MRSTMYKFRTEAWGKKLNHELNWTTCYSDHVNGYGHFHKHTDMHRKKIPQVNRNSYRPFISKMDDPEPYKRPDTDHMWSILNKAKGGSNSIVSGSTAVRARLRKMMKEGHKRRQNNAKPAKNVTDDIDKPNEVNFSGKIPLPPLDPIEEDDPEEIEEDRAEQTIVAPKNPLVTISMPDLQGPRAANEMISPRREPALHPYVRHSLSADKEVVEWFTHPPPGPKHHSQRLGDPINLPVAGLPTVWNVYKPRRILQNPPPYIPQPAPLPFSETHRSHNTPRLQDLKPITLRPPPKRTHTSNAVTQTTPPPPPPSPPSLPELKRAGPQNPRLSRQRLPEHLKVTPQVPVPDRRKELAALLTRGRKDGVDLSWILDKSTKWTRPRGSIGPPIRGLHRPQGQWKTGQQTVKTK